MSFNVKAREQVNKMKKNLGINTPRICAGLLMVTSIPQFFYMYKAVQAELQMLKNIRKSIDYQNYKNAFFASVILGLEAVNFYDQKAKNVIPRKGPAYLFALIPIGVGLFTQTFVFNDQIDKKVVFPSLLSDASLLALEAKLANEAFIPFWFFNLRYQMHLFDIFSLTLMYFALKHINQDMEKNPHRYLQQEEDLVLQEVQQQ